METVARNYVLQTDSSTALTLADMRRFAVVAWGTFGGSVVDKWAELNDAYFGGRLQPVPIVLTNAQPFGSRYAFCSYGGELGRTITLNVPRLHHRLLADNCTLLHEMIHQFLNETGESAAHSSCGWRREIMRLHHIITGQEIWAGRSKSSRDPVAKRVVRINEPKADGTPSLRQGDIARWPRSCGINLGTLGLPA